jgi:hypothetical protein
MKEVYYPLVARGYSEDQAGLAAGKAARNIDMLAGIEERSSIILSIEEAFEDLR